MKTVKGLFSLRTKLFLAFFLLSAVITLAISYRLFVHMRTDHLNTLKRDLTVIADLAVTQDEGKRISQLVVTSRDAAAGNQAVQDLQQRLTSENLDIERISVWQVTAAGEYVVWADGQNALTDNGGRFIPAPYREWLPVEQTRPVVVEIPDRSFEIVAYAPLKDTNGKVIALIGIAVNGEKVAADVQHFIEQVAKVAIWAILVVDVISWWLARGFTHRLSRLYEAMDEMAAGNLEIVLPENGQDEVALLANRLNQLAVSLASEREEMLLSAIESLVTALEAKDTYTYGHSSQVSAMAYAIARQIGLKEQELFTVRIAALLHDIGKIGIPDQVLNKPGRLDEEERRLIEQHPVIGAKILVGIPALAQVTEMVKHHHARWDGTGYPEILSGEAIPLGARIIAVADTYQAMTSDRPYRKGLAPEIALAELKRCAGSQFEPVLVEAFIKVWPGVKTEKA